ncbi:MAG TPA: 3'(2'),5'-bisphosphate nucleotidase [Alphaproteobacteria bacterium]|nr:3'(2'),5'-bisphosphate nucleotidase [Alphaproteobacteria bacterium]
MTINITKHFVNQVRDLAARAGKEIMEIFNAGFTVEIKADKSPVTEADRRAETLITNAIREGITDSFPIVGEEAVAAGNTPDVGGGPFWLVDALDGTKEFIKKGPEFTVNIALIEATKPVLGVVYAPALKSAYWGSPLGAFAETGGSQPVAISCRRPPVDGLVAFVSKSHKTPKVDEYLKQFTIKKEISASSSLKFCRLATGQADIYPRFGRTMEWDTAAAHAVLAAAGGRVEKFDGAPLAYAKPGLENPGFVAFGLPPKNSGS